MPTLYSGNPANVAIPQAIPIAGLGGGGGVNPVTVTTLTPHGFAQGDSIVIQGVPGASSSANSPPNTPWLISTILNAFQFQLANSTGVTISGWSGGGVCYDLSPNPPISMQSDGDPDNASAKNVGPQGLADRTAFLTLALANYRPIAVYKGGASDDSWAQWASQAIATSAWDGLKQSSSYVGDLYNFPGSGTPVPRINLGDTLSTSWQLGEVLRGTSSGDFAITLAYQFSSLNANAWVQAVGGALRFPAFPSGGVSFVGTVPYPAAGSDLVQVTGGAAAASVGTVTAGVATITGLSGMSSQSVGDTLVLAGCGDPGNNGGFPITAYVSATSVKVANPNAVASDPNNGAIVWYPTNMTFNIELQAMSPTAVSSTYDLRGHRSMQTIHMRPPVWPWPITVM